MPHQELSLRFFTDLSRFQACYNPHLEAHSPQRYGQTPRLRHISIPVGDESRRFEEIQ